jgi:16S rRNA (guanine527-N7)-methyltransferase
MWTQLKKYNLSTSQQQKFETYLNLLLEENEKYNLTAITDPADVVAYHFADSLALLKLHDMTDVRTIIDVGSGAGLPGMALAIAKPEISFMLIEVNLKKVNFLNMVIQALALENVQVNSSDWRTFLRRKHVASSNTMVVARASLAVEELVRIFAPSSEFKNGLLVYWATKKWIPTDQEKRYLDHCAPYTVAQKERKLCFFNGSIEK